MKRSRATIVLCSLGLTVCGKASTPTPDETQSKQATRAIERPRAIERAAPRVDMPKGVERQPPREQEVEASSALDYFQEDLDAASEQLAPFADGTEDPHAHLDTVKEIYRSLYPLDSFVTNHLREHRDELSDETRDALGRISVGITGLNHLLLLPEDPTDPDRLEDFISNTLDAIDRIKPVLRELEAPRDPS